MQLRMVNIANALLISLIQHQYLSFCVIASSNFDTITIDKPIRDRDGDLLLSNAKTFALGFFSSGKSQSRYLGIWYYNLPQQTVAWVANRDNCINNTSGVLSINPDDGNLVLHTNYSTSPIWSTNVSPTPPNPNNRVVAQLTDLGNLVLIQIQIQTNTNTNTILWQSFQHPTDTWLPYLKVGLDKKTGHSWFIRSWKTDADPSSGNFMVMLNTTGKTQLVMYNQGHPWWRGGSFNGEVFVGMPSMKRDVTAFNICYVDNDNEVTLTSNMLNKSMIYRLEVDQSGFFQAFIWNTQKRQWDRYWSFPKEQCDNYGTCGPNSNCDPLNYADSQCTCLPGFEPRNPHEWYQNEHWSGGCVRKQGRSVCGNGEGFVIVESVKIPDTGVAIEKAGLSLQQCEEDCLKNCSCMGYATADVRNGGSGCLAWYGDLMDIQKLSEQGQDLYVRVDAIELANYPKEKKSRRTPSVKVIVAIPVGSLTAITLLVALCLYYLRKRKIRDRVELLSNQDSSREKEQGESKVRPEILPFFNFKIITAATNNFACENKLGEGGFGSVYKGRFINGQEIAVKRLSEDSGQGTAEFKNEVKVIVRLQHRNLVRLLGCCIHKKERMLIYEYLPNKSLDFLIFDTSQRSALDWGQRFEIILGIARGILYLHQDSRLKIIHRDLKASNILLDAAMNPKISDFGMAKIFREDQIQARTGRVVGTFGYMSPEYIMQGQYSIKSDVFSFGVLMLEIVAGKRNTDREQGRASLNLIGHVWDLWTEGRALDIMDSTLGESYVADVALKCVQIGLLCVQESPMNRPSMSEVVFMLGNETTIPSPQKPAFVFNGNQGLPEQSTPPQGESPSLNELTATTLSAR